MDRRTRGWNDSNSSLLSIILYTYQQGFTYALSQLTGAAEINNFDGRSLGIAQQYVLGLQITVYYVQFGCAQEQEGRAQLLRKFAREVQRDATEICVPKQIVQVIREQLEDEAQMIAPHKMALELDCK